MTGLPDVTSQPLGGAGRLAALPDDSASLYKSLAAKLGHARRCEMVWVMDLDWYKQMRRTAPKQPDGEEDEGKWVPDIEDRLLGRRVLVRGDGGEPHIEWMTPDEAKAAASADELAAPPACEAHIAEIKRIGAREGVLRIALKQVILATPVGRHASPDECEGIRNLASEALR